MPRWTDQSRAEQQERIQQQRPWTRSTGPRSEYGRQVSSRNAVKKKKPLSQQLHSAFTSTCENATEVSLQTNECAIGRPLEVGDRVTYLGGYEPTMHACGHDPMMVAGFCQLGTGAIACQTVGGRIIWIYPRDLERCHVGMKQHGANKRS